MNLQDELQKLDELKAEIDSLRPIDANQERLVMQKLRLDWNYNSNAIEGNTLSIGETAALLGHGLTAKGKPLKDHLDIQGHNAALDMLSEFVREKEPLTEFMIRSLHHAMLGETREEVVVNEQGLRTVRSVTAGAYKTQANHVVTATGVVRAFASPVETPALMHDLVASYERERRVRTMHPVIFAAIFHHRFVSIHPFDDGNGRMARILMNLILMQSEYLPAVLRLSERNAYIASLVQADNGEFNALQELVADACLRSSELYVSAAKGGAVDGLEDFDKRLALISQSVLAERKTDGKEATFIDHVRIFDVLLCPVFDSISVRLKHIDPMFARKDRLFVAKFESGTLVMERSMKDYQRAVRIAVMADLLVEAEFSYEARSFVRNATTSLSASVRASFYPREFAIQTLMTTTGTSEVFRGDYESTFTSADTERASKKVLDQLLETVTQITQAR